MTTEALLESDALDTVRRQIRKNLISEGIMTETLNNGNQKTQRPTCEEAENRIKELSAMSKLEYELIRSDEASKLGLRVNVLDELTNNFKNEIEEKSDNILFPTVTPWNDVVELRALLDDITQTLNRFVVFQSEHESRAIALYIIHTYCFEAFDLTPFLFISSPEKRCGKSTLLELVFELVSKPLVATNLTPAAFFRSVEKFNPTLLIEEVDAFMRENEELRGIVNGSNRRSLSFVLRCVGDPPEPIQFNTYCPKVFCGIGKLPETIEDRAIIIRLNRKTAKEAKEKRRLRNKSQQQTFSDLRSKCARFAQDNIEKFKAMDYEKDVEPLIPKSLDSRAGDNWEPPLAIARLAGAKWVEYAQKAAIQLSGAKEETPSTGVELLIDIQDIFGLTTEKMFSKELLEKLHKIDDAPWPTFHNGKPMTHRQLGNRLSDFKINSKDIRIGGDKAKGFERNQFKDVWERYIPDENNTFQNTPNFAETAETARQVNNGGGSECLSYDAVSDREPRQTIIENTCLANVSVEQARQMQMSRIEKTSQPNNDKACLAVSDKTPILRVVSEGMDTQKIEPNYIDI